MLFETQILSHREVAQGTQEVTFRRPNDFVFCAGQYLQIQLSKLLAPDSKGISRLFSIVSSPYDMECLKVVFRSSGSGFKNTLLSLLPGDSVTIDQAAGSFILPQSPQRPSVFIAGGVGIAPFMSYLYQKIPDTWEHPITLVFGNRSPENAAYLSELRQMKKEQKYFDFVELYKKPTIDLFKELTKKHEDSIWWIVGPPAMVSVTMNGLRFGGISEKYILTESFEGY